MREVKAIIRPQRLQAVLHALQGIIDMPGVIVSTVHAYGKVTVPAPNTGTFGETTMSKLEAVVPEHLLDAVVDAIQTAAHTGHPGDGKVFVVAVDTVLSVRTGERASDS